METCPSDTAFVDGAFEVVGAIAGGHALSGCAVWSFVTAADTSDGRHRANQRDEDGR